MTAHPRSDRLDRWSPLIRNGLTWLIEQAPPPGDQATTVNNTESYRLSRSGQITLGLIMALLAFLLYRQTFGANQQLSKRFAFCRSLQFVELAQIESEQQTMSMINNLASATPGQKLRLRQQYKLLLLDSDRLCSLGYFYRSQEAALMTVATSAFCLLSLTFAVGFAHGVVNNTNRTLQAVQVSAMGLLVVPVLFLQLGEQQRDTSIYLQLYLAHRHLIQQLKSAVANQDLPILTTDSSEANQTEQRDVPRLTDTGKVAQLIRRIDQQLEGFPPIPINLNDTTAKHVYGWLSRSWKQEISK
jgi:hypothetical protein